MMILAIWLLLDSSHAGGLGPRPPPRCEPKLAKAAPGTEHHAIVYDRFVAVLVAELRDEPTSPTDRHLVAEVNRAYAELYGPLRPSDLASELIRTTAARSDRLLRAIARLDSPDFRPSGQIKLDGSRGDEDLIRHYDRYVSFCYRSRRPGHDISREDQDFARVVEQAHFDLHGEKPLRQFLAGMPSRRDRHLVEAIEVVLHARLQKQIEHLKARTRGSYEHVNALYDRYKSLAKMTLLSIDPLTAEEKVFFGKIETYYEQIWGHPPDRRKYAEWPKRQETLSRAVDTYLLLEPPPSLPPPPDLKDEAFRL
jgi:hypothetical protein